MSVSSTSKTSAATLNNTAKNSSTMRRYVKAGYGWNYDDSLLTYDGATDSVTGLDVLYDSEGTLPVFTNQSKNVA